MSSLSSLLWSTNRRKSTYLSASRLSSTVRLLSDRNKPRNSGDKGPERNFKKKMVKKAHKVMSPDILMKNLKVTEAGEYHQQSLNTGVEDNLQELLSGFSVRQQRDIVKVKKQEQKPEKEIGTNYISTQALRPISFSNPCFGRRLAVFEPLDPHIRTMPTGRYNLTEEEKHKKLKSIHLLQTTSYFEDLKRVSYPREFPVDNENYTSPESEVNFKDHVLLDHLVKDFPSKGPVRHFMELVVTGLSMNPDYSVAEKKDFINWYKDYFAQFTSEELQALSHFNKK